MEKLKIHNAIVERATGKVIICQVLEMPNAFISLDGKRHFMKSKFRSIGIKEYVDEVKKLRG